MVNAESGWLTAKELPTNFDSHFLLMTDDDD
jgi:hypothetical protein